MSVLKALRRGLSHSCIAEQLSNVRTHFTMMHIAPLQKSALEEKCILVDEHDRVVGAASKKHCHQLNKDNGSPLHRAFSVFLFNGKGDLLLQKRSPTKITFPDHYTNTCCSHPLADFPGEDVEENAIGICRAAQRRLGYELGIPAHEVKANEFSYVTRIHYQAACDSYWGEHEIDYVLFIQKDKVTLDPNPDEVSEVRWVSRKDIDQFAKTIDSPLTPWFKLILDHQLSHWWDHLHNLKQIQDHKTIHRFD